MPSLCNNRIDILNQKNKAIYSNQQKKIFTLRIRLITVTIFNKNRDYKKLSEWALKDILFRKRETIKTNIITLFFLYCLYNNQSLLSRAWWNGKKLMIYVEF